MPSYSIEEKKRNSVWILWLGCLRVVESWRNNAKSWRNSPVLLCNRTNIIGRTLFLEKLMNRHHDLWRCKCVKKYRIPVLLLSLFLEEKEKKIAKWYENYWNLICEHWKFSKRIFSQRNKFLFLMKFGRYWVYTCVCKYMEFFNLNFARKILLQYLLFFSLFLKRKNTTFFFVF